MGLLKTWLGIEKLEHNFAKLEDQVDQDQEKLKQLTQKIEELEKDVNTLEKDVDKNTHDIRDLQPVTIDLTDREREILEVFLQREDEYLDINDISRNMDLKTSSVRAHMSNLKKKVDFDSRTLDNNKKEYLLPGQVREEIFQKH